MHELIDLLFCIHLFLEILEWLSSTFESSLRSELTTVTQNKSKVVVYAVC